MENQPNPYDRKLNSCEHSGWTKEACFSCNKEHESARLQWILKQLIKEKSDV